MATGRRPGRAFRIGVGVAAAMFAIGGLVPAVAVLAAMLAVHVGRSPDRMVDAMYLMAFCAVGYLAG